MSRHTLKKKRFNNVRPSILLLLLPLAVGAVTIVVIASGIYLNNLSKVNNNRLVTENWQAASTSLQAQQPKYDRKYAYFKVRDGETIQDIANYFSVKLDTIVKLNPGTIVAGTTIKIPPVEHPLVPITETNKKIKLAKVALDDKGILRITQKYNLRQPIITTIPELTTFLAPYNAITQTGPMSYRINRALSFDGNIRIDITSKTIKKLELKSSHNNITCLCMDESVALIDGVEITTFDPDTNAVDKNSVDGRSYVRMKNGRMDVLNSNLNNLGAGLDSANETSPVLPKQTEGGTYGVSWRISDDQLGKKIATGWVENNVFSRNHFGAYSYGASGITWRNNLFDYNEIYGLDPHDDSNNALIEDNVFAHNGKHGFIVSKRCNYNIIRNNTSYDNKYHGFMLHQDSAYNVIENNVSYGNVDNFVIYASNFNTIRNNISYNPRSSHVRINKLAKNNFVTGNQLFGGKRGIYLYDGTTNSYIADNTIGQVDKEIMLVNTRNTVFAQNTVNSLHYDISQKDRIIFGPNTVKLSEATVPTSPAYPAKYTQK